MSLSARAFFSVLTLGVLGYLLYNYFELRYSMEENVLWYDAGPTNTNWNMRNVLAWAFFSKAIIMTFARLKGRRYLKTMRDVADIIIIPSEGRKENLARATVQFDHNDGSGWPLMVLQK